MLSHSQAKTLQLLFDVTHYRSEGLHPFSYDWVTQVLEPHEKAVTKRAFNQLLSLGHIERGRRTSQGYYAFERDMRVWYTDNEFCLTITAWEAWEAWYVAIGHKLPGTEAIWG